MNRIFRTLFPVLLLVPVTALFGQTADKENAYRVWYGCDLPPRGYDDSVKVEEGAFVNGHREGKWIRYREDGKTPRSIVFYENGRPSGRYKTVYPNGNVKESGTFRKNMHSDTLKRFHVNGQTAYAAWYNDNGKEDGAVRYYYLNGQQEAVYTAVNGIPKDSMLRYYDSGEIKEVVYFDTAGNVKRSQSFQRQHAPVVPSSQEPQRAPELTKGCVTGPHFKPDGYNKIYTTDSDIWQDGIFQGGRLWDGKVYIYDTDGILTEVHLYKNGVFHSNGQL